MSRALAVSTHAIAEEQAQRSLISGGSALAAALSGFFAAAGAEAGILLGPVGLLLGGLGAGARAFDGRCRQPGLLGKRPRGVPPGHEPSPRAHVAAPASLAALVVAASYEPGLSLAACIRPGVTRAREGGAFGRARLLELVGEKGALAFQDDSVRKAYLAQFSAVEGGQVTAADLKPPAGLDLEALESSGALTLAAPNGDEAASDRGAAGKLQALLVGDAQGQFALLGFTELDSALEFEGYEVLVPTVAIPVERGVPRVKVGTPLGRLPELRLAREAGVVTSASAELGAGRSRLVLYRNPITREISRVSA